MEGERGWARLGQRLKARAKLWDPPERHPYAVDGERWPRGGRPLPRSGEHGQGVLVGTNAGWASFPARPRSGAASHFQ
jgi:hypothetical protein